MTRPFIRLWLPAYGYMAFIFVWSSFPVPFPPGIPIPFFDKWVHLVEYAFLGYLLARAFRNDSPDALRQNFRSAAIFFAVLYGASDEYHQWFVPNRVSSWTDLIADGLGAAIGQLFYRNGSPHGFFSKENRSAFRLRRKP